MTGPVHSPSGVGAPQELQRLRRDLGALLQETDLHRRLDSLETVVVRIHLNQFGLAADLPTADRPTTIEGWVTWVAEHSPGS